jgi:acyl transferase domain-containing protein/NADPH:quinone reductase-like Zn-dependent oxidoreductase/acyl carrier protein
MDVAIVGIACRFPGGAETPEQFWELLCSGGDAITEMPADRFDLESLYDPDAGKAGTLYTRWGGFLERIDEFDADFFGISPREARRIDPQQRLLLEVAWEALEDAGLPPDELAGSGAGVFVGISTNDYGSLGFQPRNAHLIDAHAPAGGALCIAANRVSYCLDFHGPSLAVDTACSSSLTALHLARQSLDSGECELAIVAGVNVLLSPEVTMGFCRASMLSPDGRCRPFSADANGYVRSEGAGAIVLEPLARAVEAGDPIRAVIRATAVNQDGRTAGISVPNAAAQKALLRHALREAGVAASEVHYVEAHGTGTAAGDPREADAIGSVYGEGRPPDRPCLIGSVKGNIGHLEAAAGIAGVIKTVLALEHRRIPPSLHFADPNPTIAFDDLRLRVVTEAEDWPAASGLGVAGVNSFGFGGANAHAILAEPPRRSALRREDDDDKAQILAISARVTEGLRDLALAYSVFLDDEHAAPVHDVCYTAAVRRSHHEHRLAVVGRSLSELAARLRAYLAGDALADVAAGRHARGLEPKLAFVFSGMGPQWFGMGRQLVDEEPVFRSTLEECDELLRPLAGWSLLEELALDEERSRIAEADRAHVANFALQVGLAALLGSWGVVPDAVVGHSSGEMAAACVAGALSLADALAVAYHRGRLQHRTSGTGGMIAAGISADEAAELVSGREHLVALAAVNGPASVTLSGDVGALDEIGGSLDRQGRFCRRLPVRVPYHGPQMAPLREELLETLADLDCRNAAIPIFSTAAGAWADGCPFDADYWWQNVSLPVLFGPAIERLAGEGFDLFVELSPHPVLAASMLECLADCDGDHLVLPTLRRNDDERRSLLRSLAMLYARGRPIEWRGVLGECGAPVRLPTYPWQRERHWFDPAPERLPPAGVDSGHPLLGRRLRAAQPTWETELGDPQLAYLDDHALAGTPTFPGAAYVETALAAAAALSGDAGAPVTLEAVEFRRLLASGGEGGRILQCSIDESEGIVAIHSAPADRDASWTLHATARLGDTRAPAEAVDLGAVRARCPTMIAVDEFYAAAAARGLRYDGAFRSVAELVHGDRESLARIVAPDGVGIATDAYVVHPGLLDSAFQAMVAAYAVDGWGELPGRGQMVVTRLERVEARGQAGECFWSHAFVDEVEGAVVRGRVEIVDDAGNVVLACHGLELRVFDERRGDVAELMCQEVWEPAPRVVDTALSGPPELAAIVAPMLDRFADEAVLGDYYTTVEPALNAMAAQFARTALKTLGWDGSREPKVEQRLGVVPRHGQLLERLLAIAAAPDDAPELGEATLAARESVRSAVRLVRESGERLAATLRGEDDARDWLVVGDASTALTEFYSRTPWGLFYNRSLAELVAAARPAGRKLRILEVGAGTGATTAAILERLPDGIAEYVFTDVSPFFVKHARERLDTAANVSFDVFDVEQEPPIPQPPFDVVVAADVVHATADVGTTLRHLRRMLAPGGLLVLLELTRRSPWLDLVFGQLEGWWRFTDRELRHSHPLLGSEAWRHALAGAGFGGVAALADDAGDGTDAAQTILLAQAPVTDRATSAEESAPHWLVLADRGAVGRRVTAELLRRGDRCTVVRPARAYRRRARDRIDLVPTDVSHWQRLLLELGDGDATPLCVMNLWSLDAPAGGELSTSTAMDFQDVCCGSIVALMQATQGGRGLGDVWLVTSGGQAVAAADGGVSPAQSTMWGIGRVLRNELSGRRCRLVDLGADPGPAEIAALFDELGVAAAEDENEIAFRGDQRFVRRLRRVSLDPAPTARRPRDVPPTTPFRLEIGSPGALETLFLREAERAQLGHGEVAIRVVAAALNFRDVLQALGMIGEASEGFGLECGGVVTSADPSCGLHPGDEVIALAVGAFGSQIVAQADVVVRKPAGLTFEEAATIPSAFVTAHYALNGLARIEAGERVLIHSASGGVGLAAIQLCRRVGARVFATAGTPEKRAFLQSLGVEHVMDSRSLAFAAEILDRTGSEGVDVVLNTLAGEGRVKGLAVLRPGGRFVDMAVRDMVRDLPLGLKPFERGLSFFSLGDVSPARRPEMGSVLRAVAADVAAGRLEPLRHTDFDLADADQAFRLMAQAGHIGKIVLTVREERYRVVQPERPLVRTDGTYLITGGLGGFALAVAAWLVRRGARHLVLASRSGAPGDEDAAALEELMGSPAEVVVKRVDVADETELDRALREIRSTMPPLRGVLHAAMTLDDDLLGRMDQQRFRAVLAPKIAGGWNLHALTRDDELDLFVLFSSGSSLIGIPAQANYAAANAFLDALAVHRRALGLPALAVNWGAIRGVGYVARRPELEERLSWEGVDGIGADDACAALEVVLRRDLGRVAVARIDWTRWTDGTAPTSPERSRPARVGTTNGNVGALRAQLGAAPADERPALLEHHLIRFAAAVLDADPERVDPQRPITEMGLDSLMAVELQTAVRQQLAVEVSLVEVLEGMTLHGLRDAVLEQMFDGARV